MLATFKNFIISEKSHGCHRLSIPPLSLKPELERSLNKGHGENFLLGVLFQRTTYALTRFRFFEQERAIYSNIRELFKEEQESSHENLGQETPHGRLVESWKKRLKHFAKSEEKEIISRDSYDRKLFKYIQLLAQNLGLYSRIYGSSVVISKVELPTERHDRYEERIKRLVVIPPLVQKRVADYLEEFSFKGEHFSSPSLTNDTHVYSQLTMASKVSDSKIRWIQGDTSQKIDCSQNTCDNSEESSMKRRKSCRLREKQRAWQNTSEGRQILQVRKSLPSYDVRELFLQALSQNQVLVVTGETGCGKTTQLPQYILECEVEAGRGASCNIICTQPRRIPVVSVAERVAAERGEDVGDSVGYRVRFEGMRGANTCLLYCTSGVLLRRLMVDPLLIGVTHVILDEIHERGMIEDFLLVVLKDHLRRSSKLKLVLMSATLNAELFSSYFNGAPILQIKGLSYPVQTYFLEDVLQMLSYKSNKFLGFTTRDTLHGSDQRTLIPGNQGGFLNWSESGSKFSLLEDLLEHICCYEKEGAVLVFMTGWEEMYSLMKQLKSHPVLGDSEKVLVISCHGGMPMTEQKLIFQHPPPNIRKVILATNLVETSLTLNDIVFVVDQGKAKETSYDALSDTPYLLPKWISKSSVRQRRGRAGRVSPGVCYHLYRRSVYDQLPEDQQPELLRTPIHSVCLQVKSLKLGNIVQFLSKALQPPNKLAVTKAVEFLQTIGALDSLEELTDLGRHLSVLPVEPRIGKMLIMGSIFHCLDPILTIAAGLNVRDPFLKPLDGRKLAEEARLKFFGDLCSDHLMLVRAYECWDLAMKENWGHSFCRDNFLSMQSLLTMSSLRKQYLDILKDLGFVQGRLEQSNENSGDYFLLRAIISAGLYPGVLFIMKNGVSCNIKSFEDGEVHIHSSSVNSKNNMGVRFPWLVFNEKVKTSQLFIRDSTGVSDSMLLLFGGQLTVGKEPGHLIMDKSGLEFLMDGELANLYVRLRNTLDDMLQLKFKIPTLNIHCKWRPLLLALQHLLHGDHCKGSFVRGCIELEEQNDLETLQNCGSASNPKNDLREQLRKEGIRIKPFLHTSHIKGFENDRQFVSVLQVRDLRFVGEPAMSKKQAERNVCADAVRWLRDPSNTREKNKRFWGSMKPRIESKC